jgi:hypothetical protein
MDTFSDVKMKRGRGKVGNERMLINERGVENYCTVGGGVGGLGCGFHL